MWDVKIAHTGYTITCTLNGIYLTVLAHACMLKSNQIKIYIVPYVHADSEALGGWITCGRRIGIDEFLNVFKCWWTIIHNRMVVLAVAVHISDKSSTSGQSDVDWCVTGWWCSMRTRWRGRDVTTDDCRPTCTMTAKVHCTLTTSSRQMKELISALGQTTTPSLLTKLCSTSDVSSAYVLCSRQSINAAAADYALHSVGLLRWIKSFCKLHTVGRSGSFRVRVGVKTSSLLIHSRVKCTESLGPTAVLLIPYA